jgi:hypothetical protein
MMPHRDSQQCKERWSHYLSPDFARGPWTKEEDALLEEKVRTHGHMWKYFENFFPGRVDTNIKNRFNVLLRRRQRDMRFIRQLSLMHQQKLMEASHPPNGKEFAERLDEWNDEEFEWISFPID